MFAKTGHQWPVFSSALTRVRAKIERKLHRQNRYERHIPGELAHLDTKRLPLMRGEAVLQPREYLFVAIDDHSQFLFPDKTSYSAAIFLEETRRAFPFPVTGIYSDNGSEYKGRKDYPVSLVCQEYGISQRYTQVKHPWTNGKAERVIKTLMTEWHSRTSPGFISRDHRRRYLYAYVDWYNQLRKHQSLEDRTPLEKLELFLKSVNNA